MKNLGRKQMMGFAPLKTVWSILFLLMTAVQPGFFATANATGLHSDAGMILGVDKLAEDVGGHEQGHHGEADASQSPSKAHVDGAKKSSDKSCEVHCAPAQAVPVEWPAFGHALVRRFAVHRFAVLQHGEYAELNRPPRSLS